MSRKRACGTWKYQQKNKIVTPNKIKMHDYYNNILVVRDAEHKCGHREQTQIQCDASHRERHRFDKTTFKKIVPFMYYMGFSRTSTPLHRSSFVALSSQQSNTTQDVNHERRRASLSRWQARLWLRRPGEQQQLRPLRPSVPRALVRRVPCKCCCNYA